MNIRELYAKILYCGFLSYKGNTYSNIKILKMKKILMIEIEFWLKVCDRLLTENFNNEDILILKEFLTLCDHNYKFKKNYWGCYDEVVLFLKNSNQKKNKFINNKNSMNIINLMESLIIDLRNLLQNNFIKYDKHHLSQIYRALHNLPRFFIHDITYKDVMRYTVSNMNNQIKEKYIQLLMIDDNQNATKK